MPVVAATGGIFVFAVSAGVRAQMQRPTTGAEGLLHETGVAKTPLEPEGQVLVHGEIWTAVADAPGIAAGDAGPRRRRRGAHAPRGARVRPASLTLPGGRMETAFYVVPVLILGLFILSSSVKILREYERAVVFRLGRLVPNRASGRASSC